MSKTAKIVVWAVIIIIVLVGGYFLMKGQGENSTGSIKIGISAPMTGEVASYGEAVVGGAELAVKEINDAGGVNGRKIELVIEDDQCGADGGITAVQKLINVDNVAAMNGPVCSAAAGPALPLIQKAGIPDVLSVASAPGLTKAGDYIFRNYPSDSFQGKYAAEYLYNTLKKSKVAVIYVQNAWGLGIKDVFINRFKELGGQVVFEDSATQDSVDFRTSLTKAKAANPDSLYVPVYPANASGLLKQIAEMGLKVTVLGGDSFDAKEVWDVSGSQGVLYLQAHLSAPDDFMNRVKSVTGKTPNAYTPFVYDAIKILAEAMKEAGSTNGAAVKAKLIGMDYKDSVAVSEVKFNADRELNTASYDVKIINNSKGEIYTGQ